jgi:hypothetical protein
MGLLDILEDQWRQGEPYRASLGGLLYGDTRPLMELMGKKTAISPDEIVDVGLLSPITPLGKAKLLEAMLKGGKSSGFELGKLTEGQAKQLSKMLGRDVQQNVNITPSALEHIYTRRIADQGFTPEEVTRFVEQAMAPRAKPIPGDKAGRGELLNAGLRDMKSKALYDARLPLDFAEDGMTAVTIIPKGLNRR